MSGLVSSLILRWNTSWKCWNVRLFEELVELVQLSWARCMWMKGSDELGRLVWTQIPSDWGQDRIPIYRHYTNVGWWYGYPISSVSRKHKLTQGCHKLDHDIFRFDGPIVTWRESALREKKIPSRSQPNSTSCTIVNVESPTHSDKATSCWTHSLANR